MSLRHEVRRRSFAADRTTVEPWALATTTTYVSPDGPLPTPPAADLTPAAQDGQKLNRLRSSQGISKTMPPPPLPADSAAASSTFSPSAARHAPSGSTSRIAKRLSLTLPIALPSSDPSRPMPSASMSTSTSTPSSVPSTPPDNSAVPSFSNVNEFIIAIAAKDRRVMELKEELAREEAELALLKKRFASADVRVSRGAVEQIELGGSRTAAPAVSESDAPLLRRSVDFDGSISTIPTPNPNLNPNQGRRRVMRGGHTRTLSLLAPAKSKLELSVPDEKTTREDARRPAHTSKSNQPFPQRASWQPRTQQSSPVVPQIVEDLKIGLRAFVEDIRQIAIGDEPIHCQPMQRAPHASQFRPESLSQSVQTDLGRSRSVQPQGASIISEAPPQTAPPTPLGMRKDAVLEKTKAAKSKHFSWTPLGFDSMDDTDWANWESPVPVKSTRWSGSTINSGVMDDIQCIPENSEDAIDSDAIKTRSTAEAPVMPATKLEELFPNMVKRLSPSNIKRTANNLIDEWEKSLLDVPEAGVANKENTAT